MGIRIESLISSSNDSNGLTFGCEIQKRPLMTAGLGPLHQYEISSSVFGESSFLLRRHRHLDTAFGAVQTVDDARARTTEGEAHHVHVL